MAIAHRFLLSAAVLVIIGGGCGQGSVPKRTATPVYNKTTGKLEELVADENADGKADARAFMDGAVLKRIEIDRDHDGRPDRWEEYAALERNAVPGEPKIVRAEEANGPDGRITRHEYYKDGELERVEEDTDLDGRVDKWETYRDRRLLYVDMDLEGTGVPTRRLTYDATGDVTSGPPPGSGSK